MSMYWLVIKQVHGSKPMALGHAIGVCVLVVIKQVHHSKRMALGHALGVCLLAGHDTGPWH